MEKQNTEEIKFIGRFYIGTFFGEDVWGNSKAKELIEWLQQENEAKDKKIKELELK